MTVSLKPLYCAILASCAHLPHIPEYLSITTEDVSDNCKEGEMLGPLCICTLR